MAILAKFCRILGFKSIFFFVFGGVGLGMIVGAIKAPNEQDKDRPEFRETPWLANDAWQSAEIRSGSKATMWGAWLFAAFWKRPDAYLDEQVRASTSPFSKVTNLEDGLSKLKADLASGAWAETNQAILNVSALDVGYRLITAKVRKN